MIRRPATAIGHFPKGGQCYCQSPAALSHRAGHANGGEVNATVLGDEPGWIPSAEPRIVT